VTKKTKRRKYTPSI